MQPELKPDPNGSRGIVNLWAIVIEAAIVLAPPFVGANYFWVTPFNSLGFGVSSEAVLYNAPQAVIPGFPSLHIVIRRQVK